MSLSTIILRIHSVMSSHLSSQLHDRIDFFFSKKPKVSIASNYSIIIRSFRRGSKFARTRWTNLLQENTIPNHDHVTPAIQLHLITFECYPKSVNELNSPFDGPFWLIYRTGGQALVRHILDSSSIVKDQTELNFGHGNRAYGIAVAMSEAVTVAANNLNKVACISTELNAYINNVHVETEVIKFDGSVNPLGLYSSW